MVPFGAARGRPGLSHGETWLPRPAETVEVPRVVRGVGVNEFNPAGLAEDVCDGCPDAQIIGRFHGVAEACIHAEEHLGRVVRLE